MNQFIETELKIEKMKSDRIKIITNPIKNETITMPSIEEYKNNVYIIDENPNDIHVYTDGSKDQTKKTGYGIYIKNGGNETK